VAEVAAARVPPLEVNILAIPLAVVVEAAEEQEQPILQEGLAALRQTEIVGIVRAAPVAQEQVLRLEEAVLEGTYFQTLREVLAAPVGHTEALVAQEQMECGLMEPQEHKLAPIVEAAQVVRFQEIAILLITEQEQG
jgi:hypothetical protein